jgi:hypothetical protein
MSMLVSMAPSLLARHVPADVRRLGVVFAHEAERFKIAAHEADV